MYARGAHILLFNVVTVLDMVSRAAPVFDRRKKRLLPSCVASISRLNRPRRLAWPRTSPFHGGNTGSNPVGDAKPFQQLTVSPPPLCRHKKGTILCINANA